MSRWIRLSSLLVQYGEVLNEVGLTESQLEDLMVSGEVEGTFEHGTGELLLDRESICTYLNGASQQANIQIGDEGDDFAEDYYTDDFGDAF